MIVEKGLEGAFLLQSFQKPLNSKEEQHYLALSQTGDREARNILVERNLRLVAHIVKKYHNGEREVEDLISIGTIGLIKAINTYKIEKGNRLVTYASRCIENELLMMLRQERKCSKEVSLYEPMGTDKEGNEISLMDIMCNQELLVEESVIFGQNVGKLYELVGTRKNSFDYAIWTLWNKGIYTKRNCGYAWNIKKLCVTAREKSRGEITE